MNNSSSFGDNLTSIKEEKEDVDWQSTACNDELPEFCEYLKGLPREYVIAFSILSFVSMATVAFYAEELIYIFIIRRPEAVASPSVDFRHRTKWILAIYPTLSVTSAVALLVPRSSSLNDLVASIYVAICVNVFLSVLIDCFGGAERMLTCLRNQEIKWGIPPLCCCCCCLPGPRLSGTSLQVLRCLVVQFAIVRPLVGYIQAVIWANASSSSSTAESSAVASNYLGTVYILSTLLAVWAFGMVYQLSKSTLEDVAIRPKFLCLQLVLLISGIQHPILTLLGFFEVFPCDPQLTLDGIVSRWHHMLVIGEMFLLNAAAKWFYRQQPLAFRRLKEPEQL